MFRNIFTKRKGFAIIQTVINMTNLELDLIIIGIILSSVGFCAFFCVLSKHKKEIWEVIQFKEEKDSGNSGRRTKEQTKIPNKEEKKR